MNAKERENVEIMKRRLAHIDGSNYSTGAAHWAAAEARALRWALGIIAAHFHDPSAVAPERSGTAS